MNYPPDLLLWALHEDNYSKDGADYTTTEILRPPQLTYLASKHEAKSLPVYKGFMSLLGTGVHNALENAAPKDAIVERRFFKKFTIEGQEVVLGGKPDFIHNALLNDYKVVMVNGAPKDGKPKPEHYLQGLFNAYLANENGVTVDTACVEYIFRDWNYGMAQRQKNYPQRPNMPVPFNLIAKDQIESLIIERLTLHVKARNGINTECSDEERWKTPDMWALKKPQAKRARKLCNTADEALTEKKQGETIEFRAGSCVRCDNWCEYAHVCPQYNNNRIMPQHA
ncbi:MAG: hypothetical protein ACPH5P_00200 [Akkermansiaceae bacterium]